MELDLFPPQQGVHFDEPSHSYLYWSERLQAWVPVSSTSHVLTETGAKGFDPKYWKLSLLKKGMQDHEAEAYMALHRDYRAHVGKDVHSLIQAEVFGTKHSPQHAESLLLLLQFREYAKGESNSLVRSCESPLIHTSLMYSGTPDLLLSSGNWALLLDPKSKATEDHPDKEDDDKVKKEDWWILQLAAYCLLIEHVYELSPDMAGNLALWKYGYRVFPYNRADLLAAKRKFLELLVQYHSEHLLQVESVVEGHVCLSDFAKANAERMLADLPAPLT